MPVLRLGARVTATLVGEPETARQGVIVHILDSLAEEENDPEVYPYVVGWGLTPCKYDALRAAGEDFADWEWRDEIQGQVYRTNELTDPVIARA